MSVRGLELLEVWPQIVTKVSESIQLLKCLTRGQKQCDMEWKKKKKYIYIYIKVKIVGGEWKKE